MQARKKESPFYHLAALARWIAAAVAAHPKVAQAIVTGCVSLLIGGGAAMTVSKTQSAQEAVTLDRRWLADSFPVYLRPMIRRVVQEENIPVFAKLDTMEEKNLEVRRFIVSTVEYLRWKALRRKRLEEERRIESEAEEGFRAHRK